MTTSDNEFAALLGDVFKAETADNFKPSVADDKQETCPCKKNLKALAKKLRLNAIHDKLEKCRGGNKA